MSTDHAVRLAVGLSALALGISVWSAMRPPEPAAPAAPSDSATAASAPVDSVPHAGLLLMLKAHERRIAALERSKLRAPTASAGSAAPGTDPDAERDPARDDAPAQTLRYVDLQWDASGVDVEQDEDGNLSATNTEPEMTGKMIIVRAKRPDGETEAVTIVVPPPES